MYGALDSVQIFGPITFVLAFVSPIFVLILIAVLWFGSRKLRIPAVLPGIPLALVSILLEVVAATMGILRAFQEISTGRSSGVRSVAASMAVATGWIPLAVMLCIGSVVALLAIQALRERREVETEPDETKGGLAARLMFFFTASSVVMCLGLAWFFERTLDLIMIVCDSTRGIEAHEKFSQVPIGEVAGMISRRLVAGDLLSLVLFPILLLAPISLLIRDVPEWVRTHSWVLGVMTVVVLVVFAFAFHQEFSYILSIAQSGLPHR